MIKPKTTQELKSMQEGGKRLAEIKEVLKDMVKPGAVPLEIDKKAEELVRKLGGEPSFKMVKDYRWTTCININDGVVHGIPTNKPFEDGDIVSIDVGIFFEGLHNDSAFTVPAGKISPAEENFLNVGKKALKESIAQAKEGNRISDITIKMQEVLEAASYNPVYDLTGHGVGRKLHEEPMIPCRLQGDPKQSPLIPSGATLAIEVIYTKGSPELVIEEDGWTISTKDGKIAALFEETIAVINGEPQVLSA